MSEITEWYQVRFDQRAVYRNAAPPGGQPWSDEFAWNDVIRVCFHTGNLFESDELYIFTSTRPESYLIPTEAAGGSDLVNELMERKLFPAEMMCQAVLTEGELFCWPPPDESPA